MSYNLAPCQCAPCVNYSLVRENLTQSNLEQYQEGSNTNMPRDARRHTRSHMAGPLYAGVDFVKPSKIRKTHLRVADNSRRFVSRGLTPPRLIQQPLPPAATPFDPPANYNRVPLFSSLFGSGPTADEIFSNLNRAEYDNLRLTCRHAAVLLPPIYGDRRLQRHGNIPSLKMVCQDRYYQPRVPAVCPLYISQDAGPRTAWFGPPVFPRTLCGRTQTIATTTPYNPANHLRSCDGPRMGISNHQSAFTLCNTCAKWASDLYNPTQWNHARLLPFCYSCSIAKHGTEEWTECDCLDEFKALPSQRLPFRTCALCTDCRTEHAEQQLTTCFDRCARMKLRKRRDLPQALANYSPWERMILYVNDWHATNRNYCLCGIDYEAIKESYPRRWVINTLEVGSWEYDYRMLFRMCLICGFHESHRPQMGNFGGLPQNVVAWDSECI